MGWACGGQGSRRHAHYGSDVSAPHVTFSLLPLPPNAQQTHCPARGVGDASPAHPRRLTTTTHSPHAACTGQRRATYQATERQVTTCPSGTPCPTRGVGIAHPLRSPTHLEKCRDVRCPHLVPVCKPVRRWGARLGRAGGWRFGTGAGSLRGKCCRAAGANRAHALTKP